MPAEWMQPADDRILEYLDEVSVARPTTIANDDRIVFSRQHVNRRLRILQKGRLVQQAESGVYQITEKGRGYLLGQEDLRDEPEPE